MSELLLLAGLLFGADPAKDEGDTEKIQGTWVPTAIRIGGKDTPEKELKKIEKLILSKGTITVTGKSRGSYKLDPSKRPRAIDLMSTDGPDKGKTAEGIYELEGETLRLCWDQPGKGRPKEFKSEEGSERVLVTFKREKK